MRSLLLLIGLLLFSTMRVGAQSPPDSPLIPCPTTPNCVHEAHEFTLPASDLANYVRQALESLSPESIEQGTVDTHVINAVFKIFGFRDDVNIAIIPNQNTTTLYIRSASRTGHSDLGVNGRRVSRILKQLRALIPD